MIRLLLALALIGGTAMAQNCNLSMMLGTYAVSYQGTLAAPQPAGPPAMLPGFILGVLSINYDGTISGGATINVGGEMAEYEGTGTIELKRGCSGTITLRMGVKGIAGPPSEEVDRFVFLPTERELRVMMYKVSMPVVYFTQLMGLALGASEREVGLQRCMVSAHEVLSKGELASVHQM